MANIQAGAPATGKLAGKKLMFVGKFGYGQNELADMQAVVEQEGGVIVDDPKLALDYLIAGDGVRGNPPAAVAKIQKKHPQVQVIDEPGFYQLTLPTAEEFLKIVLAGEESYELRMSMESRLFKCSNGLDLSGTDFRNKTIAWMSCNISVDQCDFRGSTIDATIFNVKGAIFDGATFQGGIFSHAEDCSLKNVTMKGTDWISTRLVRCDFSGARLQIENGSGATAIECNFQKADLSSGNFAMSKFMRADFKDATLINAKLQGTDFSGANFTGANLGRANLREANFLNADLRQANFTDANLSNANLTDAIIDGVDFTGANMKDATLTGLDLTKAKGLVPKAGHQAGPKIRELSTVAYGSQKFDTSIVIRLGDDETVTLVAFINRFENLVYASTKYWHQNGSNSQQSGIPVSSFEQAMLDLVEMWSRGKPDFDTVKVVATKCPLRGQVLKDLVISAWYEACGLEVPSKNDLEREAKRIESNTAALRETMIAELHAGIDGVKKVDSIVYRDTFDSIDKICGRDVQFLKGQKVKWCCESMPGFVPPPRDE